MNNQAASSVLMIRPVSFGFDEQTAKTNVFQHRLRLKAVRVTQRALEEFENAVQTLQKHGLEVVVFFEEEPTTPKPNGVFVNNWLSTWSDGTVYLYPMATESRRLERDPRVLELLKKRFALKTVVDISFHERRQKFLEGTGVLVFDHLNKFVYATASPRCDEALLLEHTRSLNYQPIVFRAFDRHKVPIYHTNVILALQSSTAIICSETISDKTERRKVLETVARTGRIVIEISHRQMEKFCGNVLELQSHSGKRFLILSQTAFDNLTATQRKLLGADKTLVPLNIPTIERVGGGSARCMLAEIFLPPKIKG